VTTIWLRRVDAWFGARLPAWAAFEILVVLYRFEAAGAGAAPSDRERRGTSTGYGAIGTCDAVAARIGGLARLGEARAVASAFVQRIADMLGWLLGILEFF